MTMPAGTNNLRPMGAGEMLDQTFKVCRQAWKPLLTLGLVSVVPSVLTTLWTQPQTAPQRTNATQSLIFRAIQSASSGNYRPLVTLGAAGLLLMVAGWLLMPFVQGGVILSTARTIEGQPVTVGTALRLGASRYFPLVGTGILKVLPLPVAMVVGVAGGGLVASLVALAWLVSLVYWSFTGQTVALEGTPAGLRPFKRSMGLVEGKFWRLVGISILIGLFTPVLVGFVTALVGALASLGAALGGGRGFETLAALLNSLGAAISTPFALVGMTVVFYDLRIRTEGLDLEMQARAQLEASQQ